MVDPLQGAAVVYMYRLPEPPDCMEYQLWVVREGKPTSAGVFKVGKDGHTVLKLQDFPDPETIASFSVTHRTDRRTTRADRDDVPHWTVI